MTSNPAEPRARALHDVVRVLSVLLTLSALAGLMTGVASSSRATLIDEVLAGGRVDPVAAEAADTLVRISVLLVIVFYSATMVVFLVWFWRLARNSAVLDRDRAPHAGWAIGSWLVPIANFWLPAVTLAKADRLSDPHTRSGGRLITAWAIVLGLAATASTVMWKLAPSELRTLQDVEAYARANRYDLIPQVALAIAAVLAILMIRRLTDRQHTALALPE
jgi:hypothetical protein